MRVRLSDVAAMARVSSTTASLVLNGKDQAIGADARERVVAAANELGYRPNPIARSLRSSQTHTIGFVSDEIVTTPYAGELIHGAQEIADKHDYAILLGNTGDEPANEKRTIDTLLDRQIDGAIYATMYHQVVEPPRQLASVPIVVLNSQPTDHSAFPWVAPDEAGGARAAVEHLADYGHRRIGYVNDDDDPQAAGERRDSYRAVLADRGLPTGPELEIAADDSDSSSIVQAATQLLRRPDRPTALFCFNDQIAAGVYIAARRLGLSVPTDLSIVGFDNLVLVAEAIDPGLTTVQLPHNEMGQWAMQTLLNLIEGEDTTAFMRMPCPLIERDSVAAPPTTK